MDKYAYRNSPQKNNQFWIKTKGEEMPEGIGKKEKLLQIFIFYGRGPNFLFNDRCTCLIVKKEEKLFHVYE